MRSHVYEQEKLTGVQSLSAFLFESMLADSTRNAFFAMMKPAKEVLLMKSTYERMGGSYQQVGDYLLPCVDPPECPNIGIWGERRRKYLQTNQKALYTAMLLGDTLNDHLAEADKSASEMFDRLVEKLKHRDCITEELKATDQMEWVQRMNAAYHEAAEIVMKELICV